MQAKIQYTPCNGYIYVYMFTRTNTKHNTGRWRQLHMVCDRVHLYARSKQKKTKKQVFLSAAFVACLLLL